MAGGLTHVAVFGLIPVGVLGLLVCHELGHALPILLAGGRAHITVGSDDGRTVRLGRLSITAGFDGLWSLFTYGRIRSSGVASKPVRAAGILGGPLVTLAAIAVLAGALLGGVAEPLSWVLWYLLVSEVYRAYKTIVPRTYSQGPYEGLSSDGGRFLQLLRS